MCVCVFAFDIKEHKTLKLPHFVDITSVSSLSRAAVLNNNNLRITLTHFFLLYSVRKKKYALLAQHKILSNNRHTYARAEDGYVHVQCKQRHTRLKLTNTLLETKAVRQKNEKFVDVVHYAFFILK